MHRVLQPRAAAFERFDLLLIPTLSVAAFPVGHLMPEHWDWIRWAGFSYPFNLTWLPPATCPCGFTPDGLQIVAGWPWYDEPMASVSSALVQKLNRFFPLNQDELASLAGLEARRRPIAAHAEVVHERQESHHAFILQEGWACAYKLLPDGGRQVIDSRCRTTSWACAACSCGPRTTPSRP